MIFIIKYVSKIVFYKYLYFIKDIINIDIFNKINLDGTRRHNRLQPKKTWYSIANIIIG